MTDNLTITEGIGTEIATDQVGTDHYQRIKLTDGLADASASINADIGAKANALRVVPANDITDATYIGDIKFGESIIAGTNLIGKVGIDQTTPGTTNRVDIGALIPGAGATNLGKAEDAGHSSGDVGVMALTVRKDSAAALSTTDVDYQPLITDANGRLHVLDANSASLAVVGGGAEATALRVTIANDSTGVVSIDDGGGAITVDGTVTSSNTAGDIAHDAGDSGNPVKVGGKAVNIDGTVPGTAVSENDRANFITDLYGRQCVETVHPNFWSASDNQSSAQTNTALKAAPGSGLSLYITDVVVSNGATAGNIKFLEDTGTPGADKIEVMYFAINGGAALHFKTPIKLTANKDFGYTSVTCTTHSITVCGYTAP